MEKLNGNKEENKRYKITESGTIYDKLNKIFIRDVKGEPVILNQTIGKVSSVDDGIEYTTKEEVDRVRQKALPASTMYDLKTYVLSRMPKEDFKNLENSAKEKGDKYGYIETHIALNYGLKKGMLTRTPPIKSGQPLGIRYNEGCPFFIKDTDIENLKEPEFEDWFINLEHRIHKLEKETKYQKRIIDALKERIVDLSDEEK